MDRIEVHFESPVYYWLSLAFVCSLVVRSLSLVS